MAIEQLQAPDRPVSIKDPVTVEAPLTDPVYVARSPLDDANLLSTLRGITHQLALLNARVEEAFNTSITMADIEQD